MNAKKSRHFSNTGRETRNSKPFRGRVTALPLPVSRLGMRTSSQTVLVAALLLIAGVDGNAQNSTAAVNARQAEADVSANNSTQISRETVVAKAASMAKPAAPAGKSTASSQLIAAANQTKASNEALVKVQEAAIAADEVKLAQLRGLVADGLVARVELENAEALLAGLRTNLETFKQNIADSEKMIADLRKAEEMAKAKPQLASAGSSSTRSFLKPTILRYGGQGGWSLDGLTAVQSFFLSNFGRVLPVSALGQSATHNRLGYDHRNAVDVALHPDSVQGKALIGYLQSQGIPYLAFRGAVPGVATGPHIHIGSPSHRT